MFTLLLKKKNNRAQYQVLAKRQVSELVETVQETDGFCVKLSALNTANDIISHTSLFKNEAPDKRQKKLTLLLIIYHSPSVH